MSYGDCKLDHSHKDETQDNELIHFASMSRLLFCQLALNLIALKLHNDRNAVH